MINKEEFRKMILDDSYVRWLSEFMKQHRNVEGGEFLELLNVTEKDKNMVKCFEILMIELRNYIFMDNSLVNKEFQDRFLLEYNNKIYCLEFWGEEASCVIDNFTIKSNENIIKYEDFKKQYQNETSLDIILNKILNRPDNFYKKVADCLTTEERLFIKDNLENKCCLNCTNASCRVPYEEKIGYDENGNPEGYLCSGWNNDVLVGKSKVLRINDVKKLK